MSDEAAIQEELVRKFPALEGKVCVARVRRLFADVPADQIAPVFEHVVKQMNFNVLCAITGLDLGESLGVMYHLAQENKTVLTLTVAVDKAAPVVQSVTPYFPAADVYEREMVDLLGMDVRGLTPGNRYPLPDGWPKGVYPLRKDCDLSGIPGSFAQEAKK
jgi:Ni,Fe-hydrogenase III component G